MKILLAAFAALCFLTACGKKAPLRPPSSDDSAPDPDAIACTEEQPGPRLLRQLHRDVGKCQTAGVVEARLDDSGNSRVLKPRQNAAFVLEAPRSKW